MNEKEEEKKKWHIETERPSVRDGKGDGDGDGDGNEGEIEKHVRGHCERGGVGIPGRGPETEGK